jgi:hypothetical protein
VIPNLFHIVEQAHDAFGPLTSPERCGKFTEYVVPLLAAIDPNFGHLRKMPGQTQFNGHAVDAALYKATGQAIDIIGASKKASIDTPAWPTWGVEEEARYTDSDTYWIAAVTLPGGDEEPDTQPAPKPVVCHCAERFQNIESLLGQLLPLATVAARESTLASARALKAAERPVPTYRGRAGFLGTVTLEPVQK